MEFPIVVQLHFHSGEKTAVGAVKREFLSLMILGVSNLSVDLTTKAVNIVFHELTHLIYYKSDKKKLVIDVIKRRVSEGDVPFFKEDKSAWRNVFEESITYPIAGRNFSYFVRKVSPSFLYMKMSDKEELEKFDYKKYKNNYDFQAKIVAYHARDLTKKYLDSGKEMDEKYIEKIIGKWNKYRG